MLGFYTRLFIFSFFCSQVLFGADTGPREKEYYLFVGNPGVGKSSLLNALVGENKFKSGKSVGAGLTKHLQEYECNGKVFLDTPGLDDIESRESAAKEIERALKKGGNYHIFFVFNLNELRLQKADLTTMELILNSINHSEKKFNLLINKLYKDELEDLRVPENLAELTFLLQKQNYATESIRFLPFDKAYKRGKKQLLKLDNNTKHFILEESVTMSIGANMVKPIEWNKYEELKKTTTKKINDLQQKIKDNNKEFKALKRTYKKASKTRNSKTNRDSGNFWGALISGIVAATFIAAEVAYSTL